MLSRYRIVEQFAAGGMGVVYLAEDLTLKRPLALKFVSATSLSQEESRARFVREARMAAALNHPNVCTIYEVGEVARGEEDALGPGRRVEPGTPYIAMELVEGRTLEAMVRQSGPLGFEELLGIALQIADGMSAAHARGIVHRDLKLGNVMVSREGRVKILDFGLAKPLEPPAPGDVAATGAETASAELTRKGHVLGTAAYMSPEQARGEHLDSRSDVFSFGVMLYELATGSRPFRGATTLSTLAKILEAEPEPIPDSRADIPPELRRIIWRCLQKKAEDRFNDTRDLVAALKALTREPTLGTSGGASPAAATEPSNVWRRGAWVAGALVLGVAALAVAWGLVYRGASTSEGTPRFQSMKIQRVQSLSGVVLGASLSPDGKFLAYATLKDGKYGLSVRQIGTGSDIRILSEHPSSILKLAFSPNGEYLYFLAEDAQQFGFRHLFQVPTLGGTARKVESDVDSAPAISPDGRTVAFVRNNPPAGEASLVLVQADGTGERKLAVRKLPNGFDEVSGPAWSPDGTRVAALIDSSEGGSHRELVAIDASDGKESRVGTSRWGLVGALSWLPDGSGLLLSGTRIGDAMGQVWLVSLPGGKVGRITNDSNDYRGVSVTADSRTLATVQQRFALDLWVAPAGNPGAAKRLTFESAGPEDLPLTIACAPSGSIVFEAASAIWSMAADGTGRRRLTPDGLECHGPLVARSTGTVVFTARRSEGGSAVWRVDPDGGRPTQLTLGDDEKAEAISPDGASLLFSKSGEDGLWRMTLDGGTPTRLEVPETGGIPPLYSSDGKALWISAWKVEGGVGRVGIEPFPRDPAEGDRWIELPRTCGAAFSYRWAPTGDAIACNGLTDGVFNVTAVPLTGGEPRAVTRFRTGHVVGFDWSPDGRKLYMMRGEPMTDVVLITDFK